MARPINQEQENLIKHLDEFLYSKKLFYLVEGIPGCGKTTIVSQYFFYHEEFKNEDIQILAPTHKARIVMQNKIDKLVEKDNSGVQLHKPITCNTVQGYLCLEKDISDSGVVTFKSNFKKKQYKKIPKIIIVDECSMVSKYCYSKLYEDSFMHQIKIIFLGDRNQLPPINERISKSFTIPNNTLLTESVRNDGAIFNLCTHIKNNIEDKTITDIIEAYCCDEGSNIYYTDDMGDYLDSIMEKTQDDFKVLNWTNKECFKMNKLLRKKLFGSNTERFYPGEKLIVTKHFCDIKENLFYSNQELIIKDITPYVFTREVMINSLKIPPRFLMKIQEIKVRCLELEKNEEDDEDRIYFVEECDKIKIVKMLEKIKKYAFRYKKQGKLKKAKEAWTVYYKIEDIFIPSVDYNYSITVHRSQGSEWEYVFVNINDICHNKNIEERNKLLYVGFSRARTKLILYR
jgi:hypothetical protein